MALIQTENRTQHWVQLDRKYRLQSRASEELVLERAEGVYMWDVEGRRYLDFESGQFGMAVGHSHPRVRSAAHAQLDQIVHHSLKLLNIPRIQVAERLARITPGELSRSYFGCSGSEANEVALRLAKKATGRFELVGVLRGYHGRSAGSGSVSSAYQREAGYGPGLPGTAFFPMPYPYRCPFGRCQQEGCNLACFDYGKEYVDRTTSGQPAAVIMEFVIGTGGLNPVPPVWATAMRQFCDERGALLIADEALTGIGRTGRWFACQHYGVAPDMLTTSKALGGGIPISAVVASDSVADAAMRNGYDQASTHMGDPFTCAVALANLETIEEEALVELAERQGAKLMAGLRALQRRHECIGDVRGLGLLIGVEIVADRERKTPSPEGAAHITQECRKRGMIIGGATTRFGLNVFRLAPPLIISDQQLDEALNILAEAFASLG